MLTTVTLWYYQILIVYGHDQPEEGKALLGAAACFRLWSDASLEVTFYSLMNRSLILVVGDSRVLAVQYFIRAQSWKCSVWKRMKFKTDNL